jgi:hypothetical protein
MKWEKEKARWLMFVISLAESTVRVWDGAAALMMPLAAL